MIRLVFLKFSLLLISATAEENATEEIQTVYAKPFEGTPGVLFITQENVTFTSTAWHLAFSVNLSSIEQDLQRVKDIFKSARSNQSHSVDFRMMKRLEQTIRSVEEEYTYLLQETQQRMIAESGPEKRSLNPLDWIGGSLGSIARELFGVASAEDVNRINSYVDVLYQRDTKIASLQNLHITAIREIEGQVQKQKDQLASLVNLTGTLFGTLLPEVKDRRTLSTTVLFLHGELATTLTTFRNTIQQLLRLVDLLNRGYVSPEILPLEDLARTLEHIKEQVPQGMELVYGGGNGSKAELYPYYHNQLASMLPGKKDIRGILQIPIAEPRNKFRVYRVMPFPTRSKGNESTHRFRWTGSETFVAMTPDNTRYAELGPWFSSSMCLPGPPMVCPAHMVFSMDPSTQCLFQLLTGKVSAKKEQCQFETVDEKVTVVKSINEVEWAVTTNEILNIRPSCLDKENPAWPIQRLDGFAVTGEVIVNIPRHCMATVGNYMIPLRLRVTTGTDEIKKQAKRTGIQVADLLEIQGRTLQADKVQDSFIEAYQQLLTLGGNVTAYDHTSEDVYRVIARMSNVSEEIKKLEPVWVTHYMSFGGWVVFGIIISVLLIMLIRFRQKVLAWAEDWSSPVPIREQAMVQVGPNRLMVSSRTAPSPRRARRDAQSVEESLM